MKNSCSVQLNVTEIGPKVLSVSLSTTLGLDPVDARAFTQNFLPIVTSSDRYMLCWLYNGSVLVTTRPEVLFASCSDLCHHDDISFALDIPAGKARFSFSPVVDRDIYMTPGACTFCYRGTFTFEPNDDEKEECSEA